MKSEEKVLDLRLGQLAISLVIDNDPVSAYTAWHLAYSIIRHINLKWSDIHTQFTPEVPSETIDIFRRAGCTTHQLNRFGDGRYCNKLAQWENLYNVDADHFVFLDSDMICVADFSTFLAPSAIAGKVVDLENPSLSLLDELFLRAGFNDRPLVVNVEADEAKTYLGNCNGGFYSVPARFCEPLFAAWRQQALLLLANIEPLRRAGKENHVDQIAFCMAVHQTALPFVQLPSNINYYVHFAGPHLLRDFSRPLAHIHYHNSSLNVLGLLEPAGAIEPDEVDAIVNANEQIGKNFQSELFWDYRYRHFPERGSGVGSRGECLLYKRDLLRLHGAEKAVSVLDVGCGDLEVVRVLNLQNYVGIDQSSESLAHASAARPDWTFYRDPANVSGTAALVICFEVVIHQVSAQEYRDLIAFLVRKVSGTLIVSGYDELTNQIATNHMLFFHEPLHKTLVDTGRFSSITKIGSHSTVVIYRCDV